MGKAVAEAAVSAGLELVPVSFSAVEVPDGKLNICDRDIRIHDLSESERILSSIVKDYPDMIVVDYTVPDAVNGKHISHFYWTAKCFIPLDTNTMLQTIWFIIHLYYCEFLYIILSYWTNFLVTSIEHFLGG
jgi:hypothetical protein